MGLFGIGKKKRILDLTEKYREQEKTGETKEESAAPSDSFSFLGNMASASNSETENYPESAEEKKRKLLKKLAEMTEKMEEISNQIYHLEQRVELLERKTGV